MENISWGPTFENFVAIRTEASMQDVKRLQSTSVQTPLSPPFKCKVPRESLSVDSQNIPCATLKRRGSWDWAISVYIWYFLTQLYETLIFHVQNRFIMLLPRHMVAIVADALGSGTGSHQRDGGGLFQTKPEKHGGVYRGGGHEREISNAGR